MMGVTEGEIYFVYVHVNLKITPKWYFEKVTRQNGLFVSGFKISSQKSMIILGYE